MNSITELKTIIKSLEDPTSKVDINDFDSIISQIMQSYSHLPSVKVLLKMIQSLAVYLISKQKAAHMDALPILNSFADHLEEIDADPGLEKSRIDEIVSDQLREFKLFQNKITSNPDIDIRDMDEIKAVILAIDWEITDETLQSFDMAVTQLLGKLKPYKIHYTFLRMIHSLGKYIGIQKVNAPTDSISFLRSVFDHLQEIIQQKEISFDEKKKILENDLSRFNDFKLRISESVKKSDPGVNQASDQDESVMPALSHIDSSEDSADEEDMSFTQLSDQEDSGQDFDEIRLTAAEPSSPDSTGSEGSQKDVMDDLFSVKESPADELLDAIHLMEIQGNSDPSGQAMKMFDTDDEQQSDGVKKFITQRNDSTPIAEIDSRLDEFFSLDEPTKSPSGSSDTSVSEIETAVDEDDVSRDSETTDFIVPFEGADENYEDADSKQHDTTDFDESSADQILKRLEDSITREDWLSDKACQDRILNDIIRLKTSWKDDSHKLCLLDIILNTLNVLLEESSQDKLDEDSLSEDTDSESVSGESPRKKGFWTKIKSNFKS